MSATNVTELQLSLEELSTDRGGEADRLTDALEADGASISPVWTEQFAASGKLGKTIAPQSVETAVRSE